eukprot:2803990-Pyramimonas_sp.AAC.1
MGVPEYEITNLRRQAGRSVAGQGPGRCLTTTLAMAMGDGGPAKAVRHQHFTAWLTMWRQYPELHPRIQKAWDTVAPRIRQAGQRKWRLAKGPLSATIATLLDIGWDPVSATQWDTDGGHSWLSPTAKDEKLQEMTSDFTLLLSDVSDSIDKQLWRKASQHEAAEDL